ncbi:MAG TPA: N-6 DNA methylase [Allosphingosinicella sp.]|jgi:hypothetical protein
MAYSDLDPRTQLEQRVSRDLRRALKKRDATVIHHGTSSGCAPSSAIADISIEWNEGGVARRLLVEVAKRSDESEFTSIVEHLNRAVAAEPTIDTNVLYSGLSTSVRMSRFLRNENQRRHKEGQRGRLIFLSLDRLQDYLKHWAKFPAVMYPVSSFTKAIARWNDFSTDIAAAQVLQEELFSNWTDKKKELDLAQLKELAIRQERLRKDIVSLENKIRDRGVNGQRAHKLLIYLFFVALYEDKRGSESRVTLAGFLEYKSKISPKDLADPEFRNRTIHHIVSNHIQFDPALVEANMLSQYNGIDLSDDFVVSDVLPIFERYPLSAGGIDFIGAVFEALARRAEKDNRIGQFFTPETAVIATVRLAAPRPSDTVLDPACGTGRFLIHAMDEMLKQAAATISETKEQVEEAVRRERLLGTDIDPWIATIAKMNMYLHGDGKSNIQPANGLALSSYDVFHPRNPARAHEAIDVALTNPPLGDVNFIEVASELARSGLLGVVEAAPGTASYPAEIRSKAKAWTRERLSVVPHRSVTEAAAKRLEASVEKWRKKLVAAGSAGDPVKERHARRYLNAAEAKLDSVRAQIAGGQIKYEPAGSNAKGGALFLSVILDYLRPIRDAGAPEEWKGGVVGVVVDEAVLNTAAYATARSFIRRNYFIKAIISLPRNAFEFLAKTTAKTSILVLYRKPDADVEQREPVFFARANTIGYTSTGVDEINDLPEVCDAFQAWGSNVRRCYVGGALEKSRLDDAVALVPMLQRRVSIYPLTEHPGERLDFSYYRMRHLIAGMSDSVPLSSFVDAVARTPNTALVDEEALMHTYAWVRSGDGRVSIKGPQDLKYSPNDLRVIKSGDILVSGIDAVRGAIGVVGEDCDGLVVSKEFFTLRIKPEFADTIDPQYVVRVLRSQKMREIIEGAITGVSNRTRIESASELLRLPISPLPPFEVQRAVAERVQAAFKAQDEAAKLFRDLDRDLSAA